MTPLAERAPAKLNLALHIRGKLPDGRHAIETLFVFCADGDRLSGEPADEVTLTAGGSFAPDLGNLDDNLVVRAAYALRHQAGAERGARLHLTKNLPVASGVGGGSADSAAALRLLTALWRIDPAHAEAVAPTLGSDVPACLLSLPARGEGAGDRLTPIALPELAGMPVLLVNPGKPLATSEVFARWDGIDRGPLDGWREGRNDLEEPAVALVPEIAAVLDWLRARDGAAFARMSGSGATCFALFAGEAARDAAAAAVPPPWWHLATWLR